jgi:hypothetical protein
MDYAAPVICYSYIRVLKMNLQVHQVITLPITLFRASRHRTKSSAELQKQCAGCT